MVFFSCGEAENSGYFKTLCGSNAMKQMIQMQAVPS